MSWLDDLVEKSPTKIDDNTLAALRRKFTVQAWMIVAALLLGFIGGALAF